MTDSRAGTVALPSDLVDVPHLVTAYYTGKPDPENIDQQVAFGTASLGRALDLAAGASATDDAAIDDLVAELSAAPAQSFVIAGELAPEHAALLAAVPNAFVPPAALRFRQPGALAEIAWRKWQMQDFADPMLLEPVYLSR